ncbi:hypothetical protein SAMN06296386_107149 [Lachnospiraceae bacterium]|nr:hypothetical protein SAMN06296386_107149 [Lachnospiraceae bacterium]
MFKNAAAPLFSRRSLAATGIILTNRPLYVNTKFQKFLYFIYQAENPLFSSLPGWLSLDLDPGFLQVLHQCCHTFLQPWYRLSHLHLRSQDVPCPE